jgi:hypothetical protein
MSIASSASLAGLAGGVAEMLWIAGYCAVTPLSTTQVLRQISSSVGLDSGDPAFAAVAGVAIHLGLSVLLGLAFALAIWRPFLRRYAIQESLLAACAVLGVIWAINFFIVLPSVNPGFAGLLPYAISLSSKLLFGIAMGGVLYRSERQAQRMIAPAV